MTQSKRTLIVSHDAGGAEVLSSWVAANQAGNEFHFLLQGPAQHVYARKLSSIHTVDEGILNQLADYRFDLVIASTSWSSDLEKRAISEAARCNIRSIAYLDHWMEYPPRFTLNDNLVLPNEIWVPDEYAQSIAKRDFPNHQIRHIPNHYLDSLVQAITPIDPQSGLRVLYVTEPTSEVARKKHGNPEHYGYTEHDALSWYLAFLKKEQQETGISIERFRLRPHPSESPSKYNSYLSNDSSDIPIEISNGSDLVDDISWSTRVGGCQSMAMHIAALAGRPVHTCIPEDADLLIPPNGISRIFEAGIPSGASA